MTKNFTHMLKHNIIAQVRSTGGGGGDEGAKMLTQFPETGVCIMSDCMKIIIYFCKRNNKYIKLR
jgi:hypothetical protein